MEPFKNQVGPVLVARVGQHLQRVWPAFARRRFESTATEGLEALALKARVRHLALALEATLPDDFDRAAAVLEAALAPAGADDDPSLPPDTDAGLAGWAVWPLAEFVARRGIDHPQRALAALHALTQRWTAEWALRPFIERHPDLAFATLQRWAADPSVHVRRLASEGSRPRLPWGLRLQSLVRDPAPTLPLLRRLQDDPSAYVRRSVANHLNDIAKDHPAVVADWLDEHLPGAGAERRTLLRHASRSLIKQGDRRVLAAWGLDRPLRGEVQLQLAPTRALLGGELTLNVTLHSTAAKAQKLAVDYALHHVKADGTLSPKVFKGWTQTLAAHEQRVLVKRHSLRPVTVRHYHAGRHALELLVNGRVVASAHFDLGL